MTSKPEANRGPSDAQRVGLVARPSLREIRAPVLATAVQFLILGAASFVAPAFYLVRTVGEPRSG